MVRLPGRALLVRANQHHRVLIKALVRILTQVVSQDQRNPEAPARVPQIPQAQVQAAAAPEVTLDHLTRADQLQTPRDPIASIGAPRRPAVRLLNRKLSRVPMP
jgi:hypothetical protein